MAMKHQKGTVYPRGRRVKMWYGKYTVYLRNEEGKEAGKRRHIPLCPKAGTPKRKAEICSTTARSRMHKGHCATRASRLGAMSMCRPSRKAC
jgi:hypothetical protein